MKKRMIAIILAALILLTGPLFHISAEAGWVTLSIRAQMLKELMSLSTDLASYDEFLKTSQEYYSRILQALDRLSLLFVTPEWDHIVQSRECALFAANDLDSFALSNYDISEEFYDYFFSQGIEEKAFSVMDLPLSTRAEYSFFFRNYLIYETERGRFDAQYFEELQESVLAMRAQVMLECSQIRSSANWLFSAMLEPAECEAVLSSLKVLYPVLFPDDYTWQHDTAALKANFSGMPVPEAQAIFQLRQDLSYWNADFSEYGDIQSGLVEGIPAVLPWPEWYQPPKSEFDVDWVEPSEETAKGITSRILVKNVDEEMLQDYLRKAQNYADDILLSENGTIIISMPDYRVYFSLSGTTMVIQFEGSDITFVPESLLA